MAELTDRQAACWKMYCEGKTQAEIGGILGISQGRVSRHIQAAMLRLYGADGTGRRGRFKVLMPPDMIDDMSDRVRAAM